MSSVNLLRSGGIAAIIAGILRGISSFLPTSMPYIDLLYLLIDLCILFGMMGLYGYQHQESGLWGFWGFLLTIIGIGIIRTGVISGIQLYPIGASIFTLGLSLFAVGSWIAKKLPRWISIFWIISTIVGFLGYFGSGLGFLFVLSGVLFGIGFAGAGIKLFG